MRTSTLVVLAASAMAALPALAAAPKNATLYKEPECSCCDRYADYLRQNGFSVKVIETDHLEQLNRAHMVSEGLEGCHTMVTGGYLIEGLVPVEVVNPLISEKPAIKGISLPGMPAGAPGMPGKKEGPFTIYELSSQAKVYALD